MSNNWNQQYLQYRQMLPMGDAPPGALPYTPPMVPGIGGINPPIDPGFTPRRPDFLPPMDPGFSPPTNPYAPPMDPGFTPGQPPSVQTPAVTPPPGMRPMKNPTPAELLGSALLGLILGGKQGAMAGAGGFAQGSFNARQAELQRQSQQQQISEEARKNKATEKWYQDQLKFNRMKELDGQIAAEQGHLTDPDWLFRNGMANPENLRHYVAWVRSLMTERGYPDGTMPTAEDVQAHVDAYRAKYPGQYGGPGLTWNPDSQKYEKSPATPEAPVQPTGIDTSVSTWLSPTHPMRPGEPRNAYPNQFPYNPYFNPTGGSGGPGTPGYQEAGDAPATAPSAAPAGPGGGSIGPPAWQIPMAPGMLPPATPGQTAAAAGLPPPTPSATPTSSPTQIKVPGTNITVTVPESTNDLIRFNPQTQMANMLQAGLSPEHATSMVQVQQAALENKVKDDMGIAQLPLTLQQSALSMAAQAADIKLKLAQATAENNKPQIAALEAGLKALTLQQQVTHETSQDEQTALGHAQTAITTEVQQKKVQIQGLRTELQTAQKDALAATDRIQKANGIQYDAHGNPVGNILGIAGVMSLPGILSKGAGFVKALAQKMEGVAGKTASQQMEAALDSFEAYTPEGVLIQGTGAAQAARAAAVTAAEGVGTAELGMAATTLRGLVGAVGGPWAAAALLGAGAVITTLKMGGGKEIHDVTYQGQHFVLEDPAVKRYLRLQAQVDALEAEPDRPVPTSTRELQISQQPTTPQEKALVRSIMNTPGAKTKGGDTIPRTFQEAYDGIMGHTGSPVQAYRLIRAFKETFPGQPVPLGLANVRGPSAEYQPPQTPLQDLTSRMQAHPAGPTSPIPPPGQRPPATPASQPPTPPRPGTAEFGAQRARTLPHLGGVNF